MNWVNSAAARAGLGPPEWLVIAIILSLLFAASFEHRRGVSSTRTLVLTRTDKLVVTALVTLIAFLAGLAVWR